MRLIYSGTDVGEDEDFLSVLAVGGAQISEGDVLVTIAGVRVQLSTGQKRVILKLGEPDGFLRAVLDAGEAEFAVAGGPDGIAVQCIIARRAHVHAYSALDAGVRYDKVLLAALEKTDFRVNACVCED